MMTMEHEDLLAKLGPYREQLERSVRPYVEITAAPGAAGPWQSKFGGRPYLPQGAACPLDQAGKPMRLLAQIHFAELPRLALFPDSGLLQFYIAAGDDLHGLSFDDPCGQLDFRVVYIPDVPAAADAEEGGPPPDDDDFPVQRELVLSYALREAAVGNADFQFEAFFGEEPYSFFERYGDDETAIWDAYTDAYGGTGHKIGGYAFFTQTDPRSAGGYDDYEVLLLQIDTDDRNGIMWGDSGVANFFIRKQDLLNRDFSKVLYNWDCY